MRQRRSPREQTDAFIKQIRSSFNDKAEEATSISMQKFAASALKILGSGQKVKLQGSPTKTPIDTGLARSNWFVTVGKPDTKTLKTIDSDNGLLTAFAGYKMGMKVYINNNLPYIRTLNQGWSTQAAPGFVQKAIAKAKGLAK